jgi:hypothetical protein
MAVFIQKFLLKDLSKLFSKFNYEEFDFQNTVKLLNHNNRYTGQILSKLGKSGYISKRQDPSDGRKKIYRINKVKFEDIMNDIGNESNDDCK